MTWIFALWKFEAEKSGSWRFDGISSRCYVRRGWVNGIVTLACFGLRLSVVAEMNRARHYT